MAETIDSLEIQISANSSRAADGLNRFTSVLNRLGGTSRTAASGVEAVNSATATAADRLTETGNSAGSAANRLRGFSREAQNTARSAKHGAAGLALFWKSLVRIAYYRAIRSIVKDIGQSFRDLYGYSKTFGTQFAKSMDSLTTSTTYLRNSLAAMAAPLINTLAPALDWVIDKVVTLLNWVNQLFAAIGGQSTYTVAKKVARTWDETFGTANKNAKKTADEIKRTILGFDEINKLTKDTNKSSSGNTGSSPYTAGYQDMFEEKPLEGWLKKLSEITSGMPDWLKWLLGGTALVGGFLLIKKFIPWLLKKLGTLFTMKIPEWLKWLFGPKGKGNNGVNLPDKIDIPDGKIKVTLDPDTINNPLPVPVKPANDAKDLFDAIRTQWYALATRVLYFIPKLDNSALALYRNFKDDWNDLPSHTLYFSPKLDNSAAVLYRNFRDDWSDIPSRTLYLSPKLDNSASVLSRNFRDDWNDLPTNTVYFSPKLNNTAKVLYDNFKREWDSVGSKVLYFSPALSNSAMVLYKNFKDAWDASGSKTLYFSPKLNNTPQVLYDNFKRDWDNSGSKTLYFTPKMNNSATVLYNNFKSDWDASGSKSLYFSPKLDNTAKVLYDGFKKEWNKIKNKVLFMSPKLDNTASALFYNIKNAWNRIENRTLYMSPKLDNTAAVLFNEFKNAWNQVKTDLTVAVKTTSADTVWTQFKREWDTFGGGTGAGGKTSGGGAGRTSHSRSVPVDVSLNKTWQNDALSSLGLTNLKTGIDVSLWKSWGKSALDALGLSNLVATISVGLKPKENNGVKMVKQTTPGGGKAWVLQAKALGGVFANGNWSSIPQYANGTPRAGSVFMAGENGPEVVGHVGGRTEVLNKSQLAAAMYSAVTAAMAPAVGNFAAAAYSMSNNDNSSPSADNATLIDLLREQNELLRQISEKEFTSEFTATGVQRALQMSNRRAGATVVPVG